jgi:hypothetical protein
MGLYHSVDIAYGIEIPTTTDIDTLDAALSNPPNPTEQISYFIVGDWHRLLLVAHTTDIDENTVTPITPDYFTRYELPAWDKALHDAATRLGCPDHPQPGWVVIHDYS